MNRFFAVVFILFTLLFCTAPGFAQNQNRVVAIVGNEIITQMDLDRAITRIESQLASDAPGRPRPSLVEIRKAALDSLIEWAIFKQMVERERLVLSDAELDNHIANIMAAGRINEQEMAAELTLRGMTLSEYREEVRLEVLKRRLIEHSVRNRVVISDEQIMRYYKDHAGQIVPGEMRLSAIFLPIGNGDEAQIQNFAQKIHNQLTAGADFTALATEFSKGPGAQHGGDLGNIKIADILPSMREAVEKLQPGQISPPTLLPGNYAIFKRALGNSNSGIMPEPTASERQQILAILEKEALDRRFTQWLNQVRSEVYVKVIED
jgi:peptidyl-prolyl cis-trans isomerase SurA